MIPLIDLWSVVRRFWWAIPILALSIALLATRASLAGVKSELRAEKTSHAETQANYRAAAEARKASDLANVQRVSTEVGTINKETADDYEARIAALRADFAERVRLATGTYPGSAPGKDLPVVPAATGGPDEAACDPKLPPKDALIASEQAERLIALQNWVRKASMINVNGARQ